MVVVGVGEAVVASRSVVATVRAVVAAKRFIVELTVDTVVNAATVVGITSGTATCVPNTVFALRKVCKRMLSAIGVFAIIYSVKNATQN